MYKIEEFVGTAAELEKFLNEMQVIKHFNLSHIVSRQAKTFAGPGCSLIEPFIPQYFMGMTKKRRDKYILNMLKKTYVKIA